MVSNSFSQIVRIAVSLALLLASCLPAAANIHQSLGLEQDRCGRQTVWYASSTKPGESGLLTAGKRANSLSSGGFFKIDGGPGRTILDSIPPLRPFAADAEIRLHHRADRSAISIRAPPR